MRGHHLLPSSQSKVRKTLVNPAAPIMLEVNHLMLEQEVVVVLFGWDAQARKNLPAVAEGLFPSVSLGEKASGK